MCCAIAGCASDRPRPLYDGARRPDAEVARVQNSALACVIRVDDRDVRQPVFAEPLAIQSAEFDLLPGPHRIRVARLYGDRPLARPGDMADVAITLVAGGRYALFASEQREGRNAGWTCGIIDLATRQPVGTVEPIGPSPRRQP